MPHVAEVRVAGVPVQVAMSRQGPGGSASHLRPTQQANHQTRFEHMQAESAENV